MIELGNKRIIKYCMEKSDVHFVIGCTLLTSADLWGTEVDFDVCYKSKFITGYWNDILQIVSYICDKYGLNETTFTEYFSAFTPPPPPMSLKPQQDPL